MVARDLLDESLEVYLKLVVGVRTYLALINFQQKTDQRFLAGKTTDILHYVTQVISHFGNAVFICIVEVRSAETFILESGIYFISYDLHDRINVLSRDLEWS